MGSSIVSGLIGGVLSVVICTYISKSMRKSETEGELKFGTFLVVLAWICMLFVVLAFLDFFYDADVWEKRSEFFSILGLIVGFGIGAIYCFGEYFKVRGEFDSKKIDFYTSWTGRKTESWDDLIEVKFNGFTNWYVLSFNSGKTIRLSNLLGGHGEVLELVKSKGHSF